MPAKGKGPTQLAFRSDEGRFQEVVECLASGYSQADMAAEFGVSKWLIKHWLHDEVYPFLGVEDRVHSRCRAARAVALAYERGILKPRRVNG